MTDVLTILGLVIYFAIGVFVCVSGFAVISFMKMALRVAPKTDAQRDAQAKFRELLAQRESFMKFSAVAAIFIWPVHIVIHLVRKIVQRFKKGTPA